MAVRRFWTGFPHECVSAHWCATRPSRCMAQWGSPRIRPLDTDSSASSLFGRWFQETSIRQGVGKWGRKEMAANTGCSFRQIITMGNWGSRLLEMIQRFASVIPSKGWEGWNICPQALPVRLLAGDFSLSGTSILPRARRASCPSQKESPSKELQVLTVRNPVSILKNDSCRGHAGTTLMLLPRAKIYFSHN